MGALTAAHDDVNTTRFTPASNDARSTRNAPSRAGTIKTFGSFGELMPSGEATCQT